MRAGRANLASSSNLVPTSNLPADIAGAVFPKINTFNRIQSEAFEFLTTCDNSLAVCAPTGCGKTALMELAMVRLVLKSRELSRGLRSNCFLPPSPPPPQKKNDIKIENFTLGIELIK